MTESKPYPLTGEEIEEIRRGGDPVRVVDLGDGETTESYVQCCMCRSDNELWLATLDAEREAHDALRAEVERLKVTGWSQAWEREARADAWDEGAIWAITADGDVWEIEQDLAPNPYRTTTDGGGD